MNTARQTSWALGPALDPIDGDVSKRIDVLRLILIALVVIGHGYRVLSALVPDQSPGMRIVMDIFNNNVTHAAIPLFFGISGYLFMRKFDLSMDAYVSMCRKKLFSILVPYILFNLIWVLWLYFVGSIEMFGSKTFLLQEGIVTKLLGIGTVPVNYPLWFLRDLLIVFILSPILLVFYKEAPLIGVVTFFSLWVLLAPETSYSLIGNMFAFYAGGLVSRYNVNLRDSGPLDKYVFPGFLASTVILIFHAELGMKHDIYMLLFKCNMLFGVVFFWCLSRYSFMKNSKFLHIGATYSFFIYLTHEPTLSWFQTNILSVYQPHGSLSQIVYFFGSGIATMLLLGSIGAILSRIIPGTYAVATGARRRR
ncbi:acyltransferase [Desulfovibrio sulfodismutans]|uniref:Acyltransferase n=1 Tax=Desulfolutivibrio sulfodismutans TaxID=63561 RepID=A0A7K3NJF3_9BACT|nr:acyltransferase [Desulfolutivibrio sulfodismutans]NDY55349.1 acyltransferase [Desulfolutivibrio sulfodismutans]QLA11050.1 acyltransferase family protein [Desulfolutivibrio sulfodismutans DSM 3696]